MIENDAEHKAFEAYRIKQKLNGDMHPLHLLYLDGDTQLHLEIFRKGYQAGQRSGMERAAEIAEKSNCLKSPFPGIIANGIRKAMEE